MTRISLFILLIFSSTFYYSCNTQKQAIKAPIKEEGADYLFAKLKENERADPDPKRQPDLAILFCGHRD
jgi:hypothetical protein